MKYVSEKIKHVISQQLTTDLVEYEDVSSPGWRFRPCCSSPGLGPMGTCKNLQCHEQLLEGWLQKPSWILTCGPSLNVLSPFSSCFFVFLNQIWSQKAGNESMKMKLQQDRPAKLKSLEQLWK